jgi:hypothetical protein
MKTFGLLANASAQKPALILNSYLTTCQKVCHCRNRFFAAFGAGTNCQDQVTERKPSARSDDLAKLGISFHILAICSKSRSDAIRRCEYFFHRHR